MRKLQFNNNNTQAQEIQPATQKVKGKTNKKLIIVVLLIVLALGGIGFAAWRWQTQVSNNAVSSDGEGTAQACTDILNPQCWTQAFQPQLKKVNNKTNVLIVGIDTRQSKYGAGLRNTDTMILARYDYATKQSELISFPRDLYAPYGCTADSMPYKTKINAIYAYGLYNCPDKNGMRVLQNTIEKISGEKIQYTILIKLEGVVQAINAIGGVDVTLPSKYTDVYPADELPPDIQKGCTHATRAPGYGFCIFSFDAGTQHLDGDHALIYARMRYWSPLGDFDRARRQQQVLTAVKDKILHSDVSITEKAQNLFNVYTSLASNVEVNLDLETVLAGLNLVNDVKDKPASIIVDPLFAGGGVIVKGDGNNFNFKDYSFQQVQGKLNLIYQNQALYVESPKIYAVNKSGIAWAKTDPIVVLKNSGLWFVNIITDTKPKDTSKTGVEIIDYTNGTKPLTLQKLKDGFGPDADVRVITANADNGLQPTKGYKEDIAVYIYPAAPASAPTK